MAVFKVPDLSKTVQVGEDGTITYPLIGQVHAAGRTAHDLEVDLKQKLGEKYLRSPQINVLVKEYNSQRVTISGAVKTTGVYAIKGRTTLLQVIAMAGDIDGSTASGDIVVFRTVDGQRSAARFDAELGQERQSRRSRSAAGRRHRGRYVGDKSRAVERLARAAAGHVGRHIRAADVMDALPTGQRA